jgi:hypothetical protein
MNDYPGSKEADTRHETLNYAAGGVPAAVGHQKSHHHYESASNGDQRQRAQASRLAVKIAVDSQDCPSQERCGEARRNPPTGFEIQACVHGSPVEDPVDRPLYNALFLLSWEDAVFKKGTVTWLDEAEAKDYPAALSYLALVFDPKQAKAYVGRLRAAPISPFKAKDIFRASGLSLLGISNSHVEKDRKKILAGRKLSPLLLVRKSDLAKVIVADGYHRLCSVYSFNEDAVIPCKII